MKLGIFTKETKIACDFDYDLLDFTSFNYDRANSACDLFVILNLKEFEIEHIIKNIRSSHNCTTYLKPIYIYTDDPILNKKIIDLSDGIFNNLNYKRIVEKATELITKNNTFQNLEIADPNIKIVIKTLRYLITREKSLEPVKSPKSKFGYLFPIISINYPNDDDFRIFKILDIFEQQKILDLEYVDKLHLCSKCNSAFINLKEVCPKCSYSDLKLEDMIHHFQCGHVDAESAFKVEDHYICPKCNKILRHIGMDYDKPSIIFTCKSCNYQTQDPDITSDCFYCEFVETMDSLKHEIIYKYSLNSSSNNFALNGLNFTVHKFLENNIQIIDYKTFNIVLNYEFKRQKRYQNLSVVTYFQIENFNELFLELSSNKEQLSLEMAKIIKDTLRDSDIISVLNENTFIFLLIETPKDNAKIVSKKLKAKIESLFAANLKDNKIKITTFSKNLQEALNSNVK